MVTRSRLKEFQDNFILMTLQTTKRQSQEGKIIKKKSDKR